MVSLAAVNAFAVAPVSYTENFISDGTEIPVQFRAWVPGDVTRIRGLFVTFPGWHGSQEGITGNETWQRRLTQMGYGVVGFRDASDENTAYWGTTSEEAHSNFQMMLELVAESFGRPEIVNAPVMLDGISQGGFVAGQLASLIPERTLGFIADKGYWHFDFEEGIYPTPGLVIVGEYDDTVDPQYIHPSFASARAAGADMAYLVEWHTPHHETSENMRITYMNQIIRARYPEGELPSLVPGNPLQLNETVGWLAEASQPDEYGNPIYNPAPASAPEPDYTLDPLLASWLPTETMNRVYLSHNDDTFNSPPLDIGIWWNLFPGMVELYFELDELPWQRMNIFHEEELVAVLTPETSPLRYNYVASKNGLHTFYAEAEYEEGGEMKTTSNYFTTTISGVIPEPSSLCLLLGAMLSTLAMPRRGLVR